MEDKEDKDGETGDVHGFEELFGEGASDSELNLRLNREGVPGRKLLYDQSGGEAWRR